MGRRARVVGHPRDTTGRAGAQAAVAVLVGMACAVGLTRALDVRVVRALAPVVYVLAVIGLVAVISPSGSTVNGSRSWIRLPGGFTLQPSELMKVGSRSALPCSSPSAPTGLRPAPSRHRPRLGRRRHPDPARAGPARPRVGPRARRDVGRHHRGRWRTAGLDRRCRRGRGRWSPLSLHDAPAHHLPAQPPAGLPRPDPRPAGHRLPDRQVRIAIGSGGDRGRALRGPADPGRLHPYQETDFIFSVAGGGARLRRCARASSCSWLPSSCGRLSGAARRHLRPARLPGIAVWLGVQAFENIGMNLGLDTGHRAAPALRLLRRLLDDRVLDRPVGLVGTVPYSGASAAEAGSASSARSGGSAVERHGRPCPAERRAPRKSYTTGHGERCLSTAGEVTRRP